LLRNSTGAFEVYDISNNNITNAASLGTVDLNWQVAGFADFNGDGMTAQFHYGHIRNLFYNIRNNMIINAAASGTEWQIIGVGNFSSVPGETDMLMRNNTTGGMLVYDIANNQITNVAFLGTAGLDWRFAGIAPVHGPGASDLVLRNIAIRSLQHRQ